MAEWKQVRDVSAFNDELQHIIIDIPNTGIEEQSGYYNWNLILVFGEKYVQESIKTLTQAKCDAESVKSAVHRLRNSYDNKYNNSKSDRSV